MKHLLKALCTLPRFLSVIGTFGLLLLATSQTTKAADYFWVNGTGLWSDVANHWATTSGGASFHQVVPSPSDDVFFDANSFTAPAQIVTVDGLFASCRNLSFTGAQFSPELTGTAVLDLYGSITLIANMTLSFTGDVNFEASTPGQTLTSGGQTWNSNFFFNGIGGGWTLQDDLMNPSRDFNFINGTFNTNNQNVTVDEFESTDPNTRSLILGSSTWTTNYTTFPGSWNINSTNLTFNAGTSHLIIAGNMGWGTAGTGLTYYDITLPSGDAELHGDGHIINGTVTFNAPNAEIAGSNMTFNGPVIFNSTGTIILNNSHTYNNTLNFAQTGTTVQFGNNATQTINGSFLMNGTCQDPITFTSLTPGTPASISQSTGSLTIDYIILQDIQATGGAAFTANNTIDAGNNSGWTINSPIPATYYWVAGTGNWNEGIHWSATSGGPPIGCVPSLIDDVIFDANSFPGGGQTMTITTTARCRNMTWMNLLNSPTWAGNATLNIYGSLTLATGMNISYTGDINFEATTTGHTITSANNTLNSNLWFNGIGGGWSLTDSLYDPGRDFNFINGAFNTNNQNVTVDEFESTDPNIRSLTLGSSTWRTNYTTFPGSWNINSSNLTFDAGTSHLIIAGNMGWGTAGTGLTYYDITLPSGDAELHGNGHIINGTVNFNSLNCEIAGSGITFNGPVNFNGTGLIAVNNSHTFNGALNFNQVGTIVEFGNNATQTINGPFNMVGTCVDPITFTSPTLGIPTTLSKTTGILTIDFINMRDIQATGGATFIANNTVDMGNNTGWTINSPIPSDYYWIGGTGNWNDGNHWSLTSGGPPVGCIPTIFDDVWFDLNSFSGPGQTVTQNVNANCKDMTWVNVAANSIFDGSGPINLFGSLTLDPGMTMNFTGPINFEATTPGQTITSAGNRLNSNLFFNGVGGEWALQDSLYNPNRDFNLINGSFITNSHNVTIDELESTDPNVRSLTLGSSTWRTNYTTFPGSWNINSTNLTFDAGTSHLIIAGNMGWGTAGTGLTYNDITFPSGDGELHGDSHIINGTVTFNSNSSGIEGQNITFNGDVIFNSPNTTTLLNSHTFNADLIFNMPGSTVNLAANTTQTLNADLEFNASPGFPIQLESSIPGTQATLSKATGDVCYNYLFIKDNNATGGATFYAGLNSADISNNTGWAFNIITPCSLILAADLLIDSITPQATVICAGSPVIYDFVVRNTGTQSSGPFSIGVFVGNDSCAGIPQTTISEAIGIPAGASQAYTASVTYPAAGPGILSIKADDSLIVPEGDETNNCGADSAVTVYELSGTPMVLSMVGCAGDSGGSATVILSGGSGNYAHQWSHGPSSDTVSGLSAGSYQVTVTDLVSGCEHTDSITLTDPPAIQIILSPTNPLCDSDSSGSIALQATGGTAPLSYLWSTGATTQNLSNVGAGSYSVQVTDSQGCSLSDSASLTAPPALSVSTSSSPASAGNNDGTATATASGGSPGYTYDWSNGGTTANLSNLAPGTYTVTVTDANGCTMVDSVMVGVLDGIADAGAGIGIMIWPNPAEGEVFVGMEGSIWGGTGMIEAKVEVRDQMGRLAWEGKHSFEEGIQAGGEMQEA